MYDLLGAKWCPQQVQPSDLNLLLRYIHSGAMILISGDGIGRKLQLPTR